MYKRKPLQPNEIEKYIRQEVARQIRKAFRTYLKITPETAKKITIALDEIEEDD